MTNRNLIASLLLPLALYGFADSSLGGFEYGLTPGPDGCEWQSPERLALKKEQPHAWFFPFASVKNALKVLPQHSEYYRSRDGKWKFNWVRTPAERPAGFYLQDYDTEGWDDIDVPGNWCVQGIRKDGSLKYGVPIYVNQKVIFYHKYQVDDWRKGVMRKASADWTIHDYPNEVGSYRRSFSVPTDWDGREVYINFDGVDSFFYLWINGRYVGFSKTHATPHRSISPSILIPGVRIAYRLKFTVTPTAHSLSRKICSVSPAYSVPPTSPLHRK